jgi:tetratricopeptide (TPR) repeat protein
MRFVLLLGVLFAIGGGSGPVAAQSDKLFEQCTNVDSPPDAVIAACSALLEVKSIPAKLRAVLFTNRAVGHVRKGNHDLAVRDLDRSIELDSSQSFPFIVRGSSYDDLGQRDRALEDFGKAIALDPKSAAAYFNRGLTYARKGDNEHALRDYDRAIELDPTDPAVFANRCRLRILVDRAAEGLTDCNEALRIDPSQGAVFAFRGWAYLALRQLGDARTDFDKALAASPNSAPSLYGRGLARRLSGDVEGGNADISAAKRINPRIPDDEAAAPGFALDGREP